MPSTDLFDILSPLSSAHAALIYLGFPLATSRVQMDSFLESLLQSLESSCQLHSSRELPVRGRSRVLNSLLLPNLWHVLRTIGVSKEFVRRTRFLMGKLLEHKMYPRATLDTLFHPLDHGYFGILDPDIQQLALKLRWLAPIIVFLRHFGTALSHRLGTPHYAQSSLHFGDPSLSTLFLYTYYQYLLTPLQDY